MNITIVLSIIAILVLLGVVLWDRHLSSNSPMLISSDGMWHIHQRSTIMGDTHNHTSSWRWSR